MESPIKPYENEWLILLRWLQYRMPKYLVGIVIKYFSTRDYNSMICSPLCYIPRSCLGCRLCIEEKDEKSTQEAERLRQLPL